MNPLIGLLKGAMVCGTMVIVSTGFTLQSK